jgi:hypothetical protein
MGYNQYSNLLKNRGFDDPQQLGLPNFMAGF